MGFALAVSHKPIRQVIRPRLIARQNRSPPMVSFAYHVALVVRTFVTSYPKEYRFATREPRPLGHKGLRCLSNCF